MISTIARLTLRIGLSLLFCLTLYGPVQASVPPSGKLDFAVLRDGNEIGSHRLVFQNSNDELRIDINTDIAVKVAFITAYRFEHEGHEVWQGGRLIRLWSRTNDDGKKHVLDAFAHGKMLEIHADGGNAEAAMDIVPASLWHPGVIAGGNLLNTLDGNRMNVQVADLGRETIPCQGKYIPAHHYKIGGELEREVWYNDSNVLIMVRFMAKDGSEIKYVLR